MRNLKSAIYIFLFLSALLCPYAFVNASTLIDVWDEPAKLPILNRFYFDNRVSNVNQIQKQAYFLSSQNKLLSNAQQFKAIKINMLGTESHVRYAQYYQGLPVWGSQIIVHHQNHTKVTGAIVLGIENDLLSVIPKLKIDDVKNIINDELSKNYAGHRLSPWRLFKSTLVVYLDGDKAKLAYYVTFFMSDVTTKRLKQPVYLIDSMSGNILNQYDNIKSDAVGTGPGGNDITLTYRSTNHYQFGNAISLLPSLGFMPVSVDTSHNKCSMLTPQVQLSSFDNVPGDDNDFPISYSDEPSYPVFSYSCTSGTLYENANDGGYSPVDNNGYFAYSPSNDAFYYAQLMYQIMQTNLPNVKNPWSTLLPIRIYTHVGNYDNAFAISPKADIEEPLSANTTVSTQEDFNPQCVLGNGDTEFYPLTNASTVGHELSHIFTTYHSNLIYANQSGAINESYSDIAGQTLEYYLSQLYSWYGYTWAIDASITLPSGTLGGKALRYFNNPPLDGHSIDNAANFVPGMDVHYSSGVYNYAFYLMVTRGINIYNAYQYFSRANVVYWQPKFDYNHASCGVIQAAFDLGHKNDYKTIKQAFSDVGVNCQVGLTQLSTSI